METQHTSKESSKDSPAVRLGQRLRTARLARNFTQSEVAQKQFSVSYISAVERGQIRPSLGALEKLADRLQVPLADLVGDDISVTPGATGPAERGEAVAERPGVDAPLREAQILILLGRGREALAVLARIAVRQLVARDLVALHRQRAHAYVQIGDGERARYEVQEALTQAERLGDHEQVGRLSVELGNVYALLGRLELALAQYNAAAEQVERGVVRDPAVRLQVLFQRGTTQLGQGDVDAALDQLGHAATLSAEVLDPMQLGAQYWSMSGTYGSQGHVARATDYAIRSLAALEDASNRRLAREVYTQLARAYAQADQLEAASTQYGIALGMAEQQHDAPGIADVLRGQALIALRQDALSVAADAIDRAIELASTAEDTASLAESLLVRAQIVEGQDDQGAAERDYDQALVLLEQSDARMLLSDAYAQYSEFLERRGESQRALGLLKQAWQLRDHSHVSH